MKVNPTQLLNKHYFDAPYDGSYPTANVYVDTFETIPSFHYLLNKPFKKNVIDHVEKVLPEYQKIFSKTSNKKNRELYQVVYANFINETFIDIYENNKTSDKQEYSIKILFNPEKDTHLPELIKSLSLTKFQSDVKGNISLIKASTYGLETVEFEIKSQVNSLEMCYGDKFIPVHNHILKTLNTPKSKGIALLHGEPGTGKSYYLKHLSTLIKNKKVLWLPQTAADSLCNPDFITFLMDNMNSVLIIEDGERVIKNREGFDSSANAVSNLLNITDGILSDCLHIQVVATFNTNIKNIDKALMRKGRLIVDYEFGKLSIDESNKLLDYLNINHTATEEMSLADIYNFENEDLSNTKTKQKKIGFR